MTETGAAVTELVREPTTVQLFAFSAATGNTHRIHYDAKYAQEGEGYPDVLVQSHLHACFLSQAVLDHWGPRARLARLGWQNRGIAVPGDQLTVTGNVIAQNRRGGETHIDVELQEHNQRDEQCVKGWATVVVTD